MRHLVALFASLFLLASCTNVKEEAEKMQKMKTEDSLRVEIHKARAHIDSLRAETAKLSKALDSLGMVKK